jgi:hypothetical protein
MCMPSSPKAPVIPQPEPIVPKEAPVLTSSKKGADNSASDSKGRGLNRFQIDLSGGNSGLNIP